MSAYAPNDLSVLSDGDLLRALLVTHQVGREEQRETQAAKGALLDELLRTLAEENTESAAHPGVSPDEIDVVERLLLHHCAARVSDSEAQLQRSLLLDELFRLGKKDGEEKPTEMSPPTPRITPNESSSREVLHRKEELDEASPILETAENPVIKSRTYHYGDELEDGGFCFPGVSSAASEEDEEDTLSDMVLPPRTASKRVHMKGGKPCESCMKVQSQERERVKRIDKLREDLFRRTAVGAVGRRLGSAGGAGSSSVYGMTVPSPYDDPYYPAFPGLQTARRERSPPRGKATPKVPSYIKSLTKSQRR